MDPPKLTSDVLGIIEKTRLIPDQTMEDRAKGIRGTKVEIILKDGNKVEETVLVPKGDPERPLTRKNIIEKLRTCAQGQSDDVKLMKLVESIESIEGAGTFENPIKVIGVVS